MKKILIIFMCLFSKNTLGQHSHSIKENEIAFLIGMLDDDNGRNINLKDPKEKCLIDRFWRKEIMSIFVDYLKKNVVNDFSEFEIEDEFLFRSLKSCKYGNCFNSYYKFKNIGIVPKLGGFEIYETFLGRLRIGKFTTNNQKFNFLMGSFVKYGKRLDSNLYSYNYNRSLSHFNAVVLFLNDTKSIIVKKTVEQYGNKQEIIFKPTEELKQLLDKLPTVK